MRATTSHAHYLIAFGAHTKPADLDLHFLDSDFGDHPLASQPGKLHAISQTERARPGLGMGLTRNRLGARLLGAPKPLKSKPFPTDALW